jgi:hypothetical protein
MEHQHPLEAVVKHKEQVVVPLTLHTHHLFNLPVEVLEATQIKHPVNLVVQAVVVVLLTEILVEMETNHRYHHHKVTLVDKLHHQVVDLMLLVVVAVLVGPVVLHPVIMLLDLGVLDPQMITEPDLTSLMPVVVAVPAGVVAVLEEEEQVVVDLVGHLITSQPMDFLMVLEFMEPQTLVEEVVVVPVQTPLRVATVDLVSLLFVIKPLPKYLKT